MKKRKVTDRSPSDVVSMDNDIKVAALLTTAAIITDRDEASFFLTTLAESIIRAMPKGVQSGAEKLIKKDALKLLETFDGSAKPRKRRVKA
jgi:hypothetical protein